MITWSTEGERRGEVITLALSFRNSSPNCLYCLRMTLCRLMLLFLSETLETICVDVWMCASVEFLQTFHSVCFNDSLVWMLLVGKELSSFCWSCFTLYSSLSEWLGYIFWRVCCCFWWCNSPKSRDFEGVKNRVSLTWRTRQLQRKQQQQQRLLTLPVAVTHSNDSLSGNIGWIALLV